MRFELVESSSGKCGQLPIRKVVTVHGCEKCGWIHKELTFRLQDGTPGIYLAECPESGQLLRLGEVFNPNQERPMSISIETALMNAARRGLEANVEVSGKERFSIWVHNFETDSTVMHDITDVADAPRLIDRAVEYLQLVADIQRK